MKILSSKWILIGLTAANVYVGSALFAAQTDVPAKSPTVQTDKTGSEEEDQKADDQATKKPLEEAKK